MNIALLGQAEVNAELLSVISQGNTIKEFALTEISQTESFDLLIDLSFDTAPAERWEFLKKTQARYFLLGACLVQLSLIDFGDKKTRIIGICNLPTLLSRKTLEYSSPTGQELNEEIIRVLNFEEALRVEDRVGMVTPRVICMIINEAYYTVQEGTASKADVDLGMKLGTAYPYGPFEWAEKMGLRNVHSLLKAVYEDTMDERYKICNLLKTEALKVV